MTQKRRAFGVWLAEVLLRPFVRLPLGFHFAMGRVLSWFLEKVMRYRRDVVLTNLARSFPDKKYKEISEIAHGFYRHLGELFAEAVWFGGCRGERGRRRLRKKRLVEYLNVEVLTAAIARGNGTMLMMSHRGNWEVFGGLFCYHGEIERNLSHDRAAVVYKRMSSKFWDRFIADNRCAPELDTAFDGYIESKDVLRHAIQHRRDNYVYMFNTDQFPYTGSLRYDVGEFLHQPTLAMGGAAALASKLGMTVLYLRWDRPSRGHWTITLVPMAEDASATTPDQLMKDYYKLLQEDIEQDPARYLWSHKRWK